MKRLFVIAAAIAAALVPVATSPAQAEGATVSVEGCTVTVASGASGIAVFDAAVASDCLTVDSYQQSGGFLNCINNVCGASVLSPPDYPVFAGTYWGFYVNGQYSNVGIGDYTADDGDVLLFTYEAYAFPVV